MTFFPPDVSLRVDPAADVAEAQKLFPQAKQLLFRALNMKQAGMPVVKLFHTGSDGSLVYVYLIGELKHVYVQPARHAVVEAAVEEVEEEVGQVVYVMLNGVVRPGTLVESAAHEFHPTAICADVYGLDYAWQDMAKLGIDTGDGFVQSRYPKPSQYSGAMKRVVQALYGIGRTGADSVASDLAGDGEIEIVNNYLFSPVVTHGVIKTPAGQGGYVWWLIEISEDRGVLKMELPLIPGTDDGGLEAVLESLGDTETLGVVSEFGGLPSGGTFPDGADLDVAISAGTVQRLASADDVAPAFHYTVDGRKMAKDFLHNNCGWAFSESGSVLEAHNTCFWYSNRTFATVWDTERADATLHRPMHYELLEYDPAVPDSVVASLEDRCCRAEHWKITFDIQGERGSAELSSVEKAFLAGPQKSSFLLADPDVFALSYVEMLRVQYGTDDALDQFEYWGRPPSVWKGQSIPYAECDAPVFVFYRGDTLEVVRHQPARVYSHDLTPHRSADNSSHNGGTDWTRVLRVPFFDGGGPDCTVGDDLVPFPGPYGLPGISGYWRNHSHFTVTIEDPVHGSDIIFCSGGPTGGSMEVSPNVYEYSVTQDYVEHATGYLSAWNDLSGLGQDWILTWTEDVSRHYEAVGIGHGDNTSAGSVVANTSSDGVVWAMHPGQEFMYDVENVAYDTQLVLEGGAVGNAYRITGYTRLYSEIWKRAGAFYSTLLDLRRNEPFGPLVIPGDPYPYVARNSPNWYSYVGAVIPAFVREAVHFVRWDGGYQLVYNEFGLAASSFTLDERMTQTLYAAGLPNPPVDGLRQDMTNVQWVKVLNAPTLRYAASINAGPDPCGIVQKGIFAAAWLPGIVMEAYTPDPTFSGSANGIPVDDCEAVSTTYVGAV